MTGRLDVTRDTALIGEGLAIVGTDNPGSPNVQAGLSRFPIYTTLGGSLGVLQRFNRVEVAVKGTAERTEYQDSVFTDGTTQSNADRDYNRYAILMRTSYDLMPGIKPFVETGADTRRYDLKIDAGGLERDSNGWNVRAGSTFAFYRLLTGEIAVGYLQRNYVDPTLQPIQGPTLDAALVYAFSALTNVKLTASTVVGETTVAGTSGVFTRNAGIEARARVPPLADRLGAIQLRPRRLCGLAARGRSLCDFRHAHLQAQPHDAGEGGAARGVAALDHTDRRLRRHRHAGGFAAAALGRTSSSGARKRVSKGQVLILQKRRIRRARPHAA